MQSKQGNSGAHPHATGGSKCTSSLKNIQSNGAGQEEERGGHTIMRLLVCAEMLFQSERPVAPLVWTGVGPRPRRHVGEGGVVAQ